MTQSKTTGRVDYPDRVIQYKPGNRGGGRPKEPPAATLTKDGMIVLNHEAVELLGSPARVLVALNPRLGRIFIRPTTPTNTQGGYSLAGGGNSPHRIGARQIVKDYPLLAGKYKVGKASEGIVLVIED